MIELCDDYTMYVNLFDEIGIGPAAFWRRSCLLSLIVRNVDGHLFGVALTTAVSSGRQHDEIFTASGVKVGEAAGHLPAVSGSTGGDAHQIFQFIKLDAMCAVSLPSLKSQVSRTVVDPHDFVEGNVECGEGFQGTIISTHGYGKLKANDVEIAEFHSALGIQLTKTTRGLCPKPGTLVTRDEKILAIIFARTTDQLLSALPVKSLLEANGFLIAAESDVRLHNQRVSEAMSNSREGVLSTSEPENFRKVREFERAIRSSRSRYAALEKVS